jgi:hypothetical protein
MYGCKYEPTTKNNLGVDCISRADAIHAVSEALERAFVEHEDIANKLIGKLPAVTLQEPKYIVNESGDLVKDLVKDTISRKAVIDTIYAECSGAKLDIDFAKVLLLQRAIKALPPATPIRPKGHWEHGRELSRVFIGDALRGINYEDWHCSNCHCVAEESIKPKWNFCPNCGAEMEEVEE